MRYILLILIACFSIGWGGARSQTNLTASQDVVAASSDVHGIGTTGNYWKNIIGSYHKFPHKSNACDNSASVGCMYVNGSGSLIFRNASGSETTVAS